MSNGVIIAVAQQTPTILLVSFVLLFVLRILYRISPFHPLAHIPGPYAARTSSLWLTYHSWLGDEASSVHAIHQKYGKIVRIGPNAVDVADGEALHPIYVEKGGFRKPDFYLNFMVDGHRTLFSEVDPHARAPRAKAVLPAFSPAYLRSRKHIIDKCVKEWVELTKTLTKSGRPVDVLALARSFAADATSESIFGVKYGALEKTRVAFTSTDRGAIADASNFRGTGMTDAFDAVGRYWYLPTWAYGWVEWAKYKLFPNSAVLDTFYALEDHAARAVEAAKLAKHDLQGTYQGRLLEAGFSEGETKAQCADGMFAGIDTTGLNLAVIMFNLTKHPHEYEALRREILEAGPDFDDVQSLPLLRAVVQEGLRITLANPTRLPRVVPAEGWQFQGNFFPRGVEVSCSSFELHKNSTVFPDPDEFQPERWLTASKEMYRDHIPFGTGSRRCIAMSLAVMKLQCAVYELVKEDVLAGARCCRDRIEFIEWLNVKVVGGRIDLEWEA